MLKSKNPTAVKSQAELIDCLLSLMQDMPYDQITVTRLCQETGLDRRTFYRNFDSKEDVLKGFLKKLGKEYLAHREQLKRKDFSSLVESSFSFFQNYLDIFQIMNENHLSGLFLSMFERFMKTHYILYDGFQEEEREYVLAYTIGGYANILIKWVNSGAKESPRQMAQLVASIVKI